MGKVYDQIDDRIREWIDQQQMFFVATAPKSDEGLVNVSPKGLDTFRVLDDHTVAYLDYGGSGIETVAHVRENGRIVIMLCAFRGPPVIYRFHGTGEIVTPNDAGYEALASQFDLSFVGVRAIIKVNVTRISDSCGWGVPLYEFEGQREVSPKYVQQRGGDHIRNYFIENNAESLDGLPGITAEEAEAYRTPQEAAE